MGDNIVYTYDGLVLIRKFYGDVTIEVLTFSLKHLIKNNMILKNQKGIISDFREADFLVSQEDMLLLKDLFIKHHNILGNLRFVQIINTPKIVSTMIFASENSDVTTRSFSTMQAAKVWINQG